MPHVRILLQKLFLKPYIPQKVVHELTKQMKMFVLCDFSFSVVVHAFKSLNTIALLLTNIPTKQRIFYFSETIQPITDKTISGYYTFYSVFLIVIIFNS